MYYVVSYCQSGKLPLMPCMAILPTGNLLLVSYGLVCFSFQLFDPPARQVVDSSTLSLGHVFRSTSKTLFGIITTDRCTNALKAIYNPVVSTIQECKRQHLKLKKLLVSSYLHPSQGTSVFEPCLWSRRKAIAH